MTSVVVPYSTAMTALGLGYDTSINRVKASPFSYEPEAETVLFHTNNDGEDGPSQTSVQYQLRFIETRDDLSKALDISGKFAAKRANISGSLSGAFLDQEIKTKSNAYLLVTVEVLHSVTRLSSLPEIDTAKVPGHENAGETTSEEKFLELYGDGYISSIQVGGRLDGLVEITAQSESDLLDIKARGKVELKGVASGELSVDYVVGSLTRNRQTRVNVTALGGGISFSPMDPRGLMRLCKAFPVMVSGGDAELLNFAVIAKTETVDGEEVTTETQKLDVEEVKYAGIAVPLRAVVSPYKGLPVFTSAPPVLSRLSGYVTDDLQEYYLSYDDAKNKVADLISNDDGSFTESHLLRLDTIRSDIRGDQASLLQLMDENSSLSDTGAARNAAELLLDVSPAETLLRRAYEVQEDANALIMQQKQEEDDKVRKQAQLREAAKQRLQAFLNKSIDIGDEGIVSGDTVRIMLAGSPLEIGSPEDAFKWIVEDRILPAGITTEEANLLTSRFHKEALSEAYNLRQQQILTDFQISGDENAFFEQGTELRNTFEDQAKFFSDIQTLAAQGADPFSKILTKIENALLAIDPGNTGALYAVEVEDGEEGLVRIKESTTGKYWRHSLQYGQMGIVTVEEASATDDKSYSFKLKPVNLNGDTTTAEIYPQAGELNWKLFGVRREETGSHLIGSRPSEMMPSDVELLTFKLQLDLSA